MSLMVKAESGKPNLQLSALMKKLRDAYGIATRIWVHSFARLFSSSSRLPERSEIRRGDSVFLKIAISVVCVLFLLQSSGFVFSSLDPRQVPLKIWFLLISFQFIMTGLAAWKWNLVLQFQSISISFRRLFLASWLSQAIGLLGLGFIGGDLYRVYFLEKREQLKRLGAAQSILYDRLSSLFGLIYFLLFGAISSIFGEATWMLFLVPFLFAAKIGRVLALGISIQAMKLLSMLILFQHFGSIDRPFGEILGLGSVAFGMELLPFSVDGFGLGHLSFFRLMSSANAAYAYHAFFISKVLFKGLGFLTPPFIGVGPKKYVLTEFQGHKG